MSLTSATRYAECAGCGSERPLAHNGRIWLQMPHDPCARRGEVHWPMATARATREGRADARTNFAIGEIIGEEVDGEIIATEIILR